MKVNVNTLTDERKKTGGPYKATGLVVISNGGKTMTTTIKGTNANGKEFCFRQTVGAVYSAATFTACVRRS